MNSQNATLLELHLSTFVPLLIEEFLTGRRTLVLPRPDLADIIAGQGDAILYRIPGKTARAVGALTEALATLAFAPGGVTFISLHFEVPPDEARRLLANLAGGGDGDP